MAFDLGVRQAEYALLQAALRGRRRPVWVYGLQGTGKTRLVRLAVARLGLTELYVRCEEVYSEDDLWAMVAEQAAACARARPARELVVVLDGAQRLALLGSALARLARLHTLPAYAHCSAAFVSRLGLDKFRDALQLYEPLPVLLAPYSRAQLERLLLLDPPAAAPADYASLYPGFVHLMAETFLVACKDLRELRRAVDLFWPRYVAPLLQRRVLLSEPHLAARLHALVAPELERHSAGAHLHELTCSDHRHLRQPAAASPSRPPAADGAAGPGSPAALGRATGSGGRGRGGAAGAGPRAEQELELPYTAKFLLIAAYLAAHCPPRHDSRLFSRVHRPERRPSATASARAGSGAEGPRPFALHRLLAIFRALVSACEAEDGAAPPRNVELSAAVASLVRLGLLSLASASLYHSAKLRCNVPREFVERLGAPYRVRLADYLDQP